MKKIFFYLPVFVMIISVPSSLNLSHKSFVSRWHTTFRSSSQLNLSCSKGFFGGRGEGGGDRLVLEEAAESTVDVICGGDSQFISSESSSTQVFTGLGVGMGVVGSGELLAIDDAVSLANFSKQSNNKNYLCMFILLANTVYMTSFWLIVL